MQDNKQQPKRPEDTPEQQAQPGTDMAQEAPRRPVTSTEELCRQLKEAFSKITPEERAEMERGTKILEKAGILDLLNDTED